MLLLLVCFLFRVRFAFYSPAVLPFSVSFHHLCCTHSCSSPSSIVACCCLRSLVVISHLLLTVGLCLLSLSQLVVGTAHGKAVVMTPPQTPSGVLLLRDDVVKVNQSTFFVSPFFGLAPLMPLRILPPIFVGLIPPAVFC